MRFVFYLSVSNDLLIMSLLCSVCLTLFQASSIMLCYLSLFYFKGELLVNIKQSGTDPLLSALQFKHKVQDTSLYRSGLVNIAAFMAVDLAMFAYMRKNSKNVPSQNSHNSQDSFTKSK